MEQQSNVKIKLIFDGWHCLSKRQQNEILAKARNVFVNANFVDNVGLLIVHNCEIEVHKFCLQVLDDYDKSFKSWNGYEIKRLSRKILFNYADRKRKLKFDYFCSLIRESKFADTKLVLAGILYLEPDEVEMNLIQIERNFERSLKDMNDEELEDVYKILIMYASSKDRKFSLNQ